MSDAKLIEHIAGGVVVSCEDNHVGPGNFGGERRVLHQVRIDCGNRGGWIPVEQYLGECVNFLGAKIPSSADMTDDVFDLEYVIVNQCEVADAGHREL